MREYHKKLYPVFAKSLKMKKSELTVNFRYHFRSDFVPEELDLSTFLDDFKSIKEFWKS